MSTWKVLVLGLLSVVCLVLAMATVIITLAKQGGERWAWLGGLLAATLFVAGLLVLFLRYADRSFDDKPQWSGR